MLSSFFHHVKSYRISNFPKSCDNFQELLRYDRERNIFFANYTIRYFIYLLLNIWLEIGRIVSLRVSICVPYTFRFTVANQTLMKKATAVIFIQRYLLKRILIIISAAISIIFLFYSLRILFLVLAP